MVTASPPPLSCANFPGHRFPRKFGQKSCIKEVLLVAVPSSSPTPRGKELVASGLRLPGSVDELKGPSPGPQGPGRGGVAGGSGPLGVNAPFALQSN